MRHANVSALLLALALALGLGLAGCGGALASGGPKTPSNTAAAPATGTPPTGSPGSTTGPASSTPGSTPNAAFAVTSFSPKNGPPTTKSIAIVFAQPVDVASLVAQKTWIAAEDDDTTSGGTFHVLNGKVDVDSAATTLTFIPTSGFTDGREVRFALTSAVLSKAGAKLAQGTASDPLSFTASVKDQVFEGRFLPKLGSTTPASTNGIPGPTVPPSTPPPPPSRAGAFEVVRTTPKANSVEPVPTSIFIEFSNAVDRSTLAGGQSPTIAVMQATSKPTTFTFPQFGIRWDQGDTRLEIISQSGITVGLDLFVILSSGLKDTAGKALETGAASSALTKKTWVAGEVFELKTTPQKVPVPALPTDPSIFQVEANTDKWFLDFDLRAADFANDMARHGLLSGDAATDKLAKDRLEAGLLSFVSMKYGRTPLGKGQAGAWKISFTATRPAGTPGKDFSREAMGGPAPSQGTLGVSNMDTGNRSKDDNAGPGSGVFCGAITGSDSKLAPALVAADKKFLDGSYALGSGTAADDDRMRRVLAVIEDWSRAAGSVTAHEVGHSVGLVHVNDPLSIMTASATSSELSEPRQYFVPASASTLDSTLGKQ